MKRATKTLLHSACSLLCMASFAGAAIAAEPTDGAPQASESEVSDADIVVTANKRTESLNSVASSVGVVSGDRLDKLQAVQLSDYLGFVPGVSLATQGTPGFGQVYIRGVTTVGSGSTVGVYVDDVPFGSSSGYGYGGFLKPDFDPSDLERVEVLKGPQGTLYGAATVGGLLKFVTKSPDLHDLTYGGKISGEAVDGGGQGYAVRANVNVPLISDKLALRVSGYHRRDAGFIDNVGTGKDNANYAISNGIYATLKAQPTEELSLKASAFYQDLDAHGVSSVAVDSPLGSPVDLDTVKTLYGRYKTDLVGKQGNRATTQLYSFSADYEIGSLTLSSNTGYSRIHDVYRSGDNGSASVDFGLPATDYINAQSDVRTTKFTEELRLASAPEQPLSWMAGFFYNHERSTVLVDYTIFKANNQIDPTVAGGNFFHTASPSLFKEYAGFANATWRIASHFDIAGGVRYSRYEQSYSSTRSGLLVTSNPFYPQVDSSQDAVSVMATASWHFEDKGLLYLRYATGFRPGGPRIFPPGSDAVLPPGSSNQFNSETLRNYEIGLRHRFFGNLLSVDAAAFLLDYNGLQGNVRVGPFGVPGNAGNATIKGGELNLGLRPDRHLTIGGALSYVHATLDEDSIAFSAKKGDDMPFAPRFTASATIDYNYPISNRLNLLLGADYRHVDHQFTDFESAGPTRIKPYGLVGARIGIRSVSGVEITAYVKNLTNNYVYTNNISPGFEGPSYLAVLAPRTFGLSVSFHN